MRIILAAIFGMFGVLRAAPLPVPAESHRVVCGIRGRNLTGQVLRVWTDTKTSRYDWVVFREGAMFRGTMGLGEAGVFWLEVDGSAADGGREGRYFAGLLRTAAFFPGEENFRGAKGYWFFSGLSKEGCANRLVSESLRPDPCWLSWGEPMGLR